MDHEPVDLLIVGASFAGCACAIRAAQLGLKVRLLDKKSDVGAKLHTTGIIVCDAVNNNPFLQNIPVQLTRRIETIRLFSPALSEVVLRSPDENTLYCFITRWHVRGYIGWAFQGTHAVQIRAAVRYRTVQGKDSRENKLINYFGCVVMRMCTLHLPYDKSKLGTARLHL